MATIATSGQQDPGSGGRLVALVFALGLHAAALLGMIYLRFTPLAPPGEQQISIDLAPQMSEAETQAANEQMRVEEIPEEAKPEGEPAEVKPVETAETPVEKPPEVEPPPPTEVTEIKPDEVKPPPLPDVVEVKPDEPEIPPPPPETVVEKPPEVVEPPPEEKIITSEAPEAEPLAPPPPAVVKKEPPPPDLKKLEAQRKARQEARREAERRKELAAKREEQRREDLEKKREAALRARKAVAGNAQRDSRSSSRQAATGSGSAGNDPNAMAAWKAAIAASIRGRMNRNAAAGTSGGVATVRFTVSRSGAVSGAGLAGSSGIGAIDSAALAAVRGSLPPAPAGFGGSSLSVTVPLRFSPGG